MLSSGQWRERRYELVHAVRTHMGASDASYSCVFQQEDEEHTTGAAFPPPAVHNLQHSHSASGLQCLLTMSPKLCLW